MARRRRTGAIGFDQKVVQDVGMAALAVRIIPMVLNNFFPLDPTLYTVAGAGGGYVAGNMMKNKTLANASIAIGLVEFVAPVIENLIGGFTSAPMEPLVGSPQKGVLIKGAPRFVEKKPTRVSDYINLNDYVPAPSNRHYQDYSDSY